MYNQTLAVVSTYMAEFDTDHTCACPCPQHCESSEHRPVCHARTVCRRTHCRWTSCVKNLSNVFRNMGSFSAFAAPYSMLKNEIVREDMRKYLLNAHVTMGLLLLHHSERLCTRPCDRPVLDICQGMAKEMYSIAWRFVDVVTGVDRQRLLWNHNQATASALLETIASEELIVESAESAASSMLQNLTLAPGRRKAVLVVACNSPSADGNGKVCGCEGQTQLMEAVARGQTHGLFCSCSSCTAQGVQAVPPTLETLGQVCAMCRANDIACATFNRYHSVDLRAVSSSRRERPQIAALRHAQCVAVCPCYLRRRCCSLTPVCWAVPVDIGSHGPRTATARGCAPRPARHRSHAALAPDDRIPVQPAQAQRLHTARGCECLRKRVRVWAVPH